MHVVFGERTVSVWSSDGAPHTNHLFSSVKLRSDGPLRRFRRRLTIAAVIQVSMRFFPCYNILKVPAHVGVDKIRRWSGMTFEPNVRDYLHVWPAHEAFKQDINAMINVGLAQR